MACRPAACSMPSPPRTSSSPPVRWAPTPLPAIRRSQPRYRPKDVSLRPRSSATSSCAPIATARWCASATWPACPSVRRPTAWLQPGMASRSAVWACSCCRVPTRSTWPPQFAPRWTSWRRTSRKASVGSRRTTPPRSSRCRSTKWCTPWSRRSSSSSW